MKKNKTYSTQRDDYLEDSEIVIEEDGVFGPFGTSSPFCHYILDKKYITSVSGIFSKKTVRIKLFNIAGSEIKQSIFGVIFNYGTIRIVTRGNDVPDISICVKNPTKVLDMISFAKKEEAAAFTRERNQRQYNNNRNSSNQNSKQRNENNKYGAR